MTEHSDNGSSCALVLRLQEQMEKCKDNISKLFAENARVDTRLLSIDAKLTETNKKLDRLLETPGRRWEGVLDAVIKLAIAAIVGYVAVRLGLS